MRRTFDTLAFSSALLITQLTSTIVFAAEPRQVLVARVGSETRAWIEHDIGDTSALLHVTNAPANLEAVLARQVGRWCPSVKRRRRRGTKTTFVLALHGVNTVPRVGWSKKPRALRIEFRVHKQPQRPDPHRMIGRIAGLGTRADSNTKLLPALEPIDCDTPTSAERCAHVEKAQMVERATAMGESLVPFERWAYRFQMQRQWLRAQPAYAYTALAAAHVLQRRGLLSEVETLLTNRSSLRAPRTAPYTALALANVYEQTERDDEARALRLTVLDAEVGDALKSRALFALLRADVQLGRFVDAAARVESLPEINVGRDDAQARAWALAAEVASAVGNDEGAYARYHQALGVAREDHLRASIHLRLGDIDLSAAGSRKAVERHYRQAVNGDECTVARLGLRRMLLAEEPHEYTLAERVESLSSEGPCPAVRMEAAYAAAFLWSAKGDDQRGVDLLEHAREASDATDATDAGAWGTDAALLEATRTILDHWTRRRARDEAWPLIIERFDGKFRRYRNLLAPASTMRLSEAYRHMHAKSDVSIELLAHVRRGQPEALEHELLIELARSYRNDSDTLRADVTARFLLERQPNPDVAWRVRHLLAEMALDEKNFVAAAAHIDAAEPTTPDGDARQEWRHLRIKTLHELAKPEDAALTLLEWLDGTPTPSTTQRSTVVNVTSACVRDCNRQLLERLLKRLEAFDGGAVLNERTRVLASQRGIEVGEPSDDAKKDGVWKRFDRAIANSTEIR